MAGIRGTIGQEIRRLVGSRSRMEKDPIERVPGDTGLFGPGSVTWAVHGDFTSMMIGGVSALLLQMLHPKALAGVWEHSNFRHDMQGRLQRTAHFVGVTTYGSTAQAEALIRRVRSIHDHVHGTMADGSTYSANDPHLLAWVHVAEMSSFLAAHLRYKNPRLSEADQDRYFDEVATLAVRLGAPDVPRSRRAVAAYLDGMRPELRSDERTRDVARIILSHRAPNLLAAPFQAVTMQAAVDLLPPWARRLHGFETPLPARPLIRASANGMGKVLRWALAPGAG